MIKQPEISGTRDPHTVQLVTDVAILAGGILCFGLAVASPARSSMKVVSRALNATFGLLTLNDGRKWQLLPERIP